jgi:hypothetical protein
MSFPQDFPGRYTIALLAFRRYQQAHIDTWMPIAQVLEKLFPGVGYIELPIVYEMPALRQFFLNEGMRAGIPDNKARERTSTLYVDKAEFLSELQIRTQDQIQVLLINQRGTILWRETGSFTPDKGKALTQKLLTLTSPVSLDHIL